jgi:hypothetical protein
MSAALTLDDMALLKQLADCGVAGLAADQPAQQFLHSSGITDEKVHAAYRLGASSPSVLSQARAILSGADLDTGGVLIPTFNPPDLAHPVGIVRLWRPERNLHRFLTFPAGVIAPTDLNEHRRVILTEIPIVALRLAQAGVPGVACADDLAVLPPLRDWLSGRELLLVSCRDGGINDLQRAVAGLGLSADALRIHADLPRTNADALARLGLDKAGLNAAEPVPITPPLLRDLVAFAQERLKDGCGADALHELNADDPTLIATYCLGFLPSGFRAALNGEARRALEHRRIENAVIVPAFDESGVAVDLLAVHPEQTGGNVHVNLMDEPAGLIAPTIATAFDEIVLADSFRAVAALFKSGQRNALLFRGLADVRQHAERLWKSGVRSAQVMFRRDGAEACTVLEAAGFSAVRLTVPKSYEGWAADRDTAALTMGAARKEPEPVPEPAVPQPVPARPQFLRYDERLQQAVFKTADATYTVEVTFDGGSKLEIRLSAGDQTHLDRFDLASEAQRRRFATSAESRTGIPAAVIGEHLIALLDGVRKLQEELHSPGQSRPGVVLSQAEKEEALKFLARADLLDAMAGHMEELGWTGEGKLKRMLLLLAVSRLLPKPISAALRAPASAGKSHAIETMLSLVPPEEIVHVSSLTNAALNYQPDLRNKILVIDEADALTLEVIVALRVLQSRGSLSRSLVSRDASGQVMTKFTEAKGPVAVLTSSTSELDTEFLSRCYDLSVDITAQQTDRILQTQRRLVRDPAQAGSAGREQTIRLHHSLHRMLRSGPRSVLVPYSDRIRFPSAAVRYRREQERFLCLIQASALLHQFQRLRHVEDGEELILADLRDYRIAVDLAADSIGRAADELSVHARDVLSLIQEKKLNNFDINDLWALRPQWTHHKLRTGLEELARLEVITSPARTRPRRYQLQAALAAMLSAPLARLLPDGAFGESGTFGETGFPVISATASTG